MTSFFSSFALAGVLTLSSASAQEPGEAARFKSLKAFSDGLRLSLDRPVPYKIRFLTEPARLVIDLEGALHAGRGRTVHVGGSAVGAVRTAQFAFAPEPVTRVVVDLAVPEALSSAELRAAVNPELVWQGAVLSVALEPEDLQDAPGMALGLPAALPRGAVGPYALPKGYGLERKDGTAGAELLAISARPGKAELRLSRRADTRTLVLSDPLRLVVDFVDAADASGYGEWQIGGRVLRAIRAADFQAGPETVARVVFTLEGSARHQFSWQGSVLTVEFPDEPAGGSSADPLAAPAEAAAGLHWPPPPGPALLEYSGLLLDGAGAELTGTYLLHFAWPSASRPEWEESVYAKAVDGLFQVILGRRLPLPERAQRHEIAVAAPEGSPWRAFSTNPEP